jgi:hypothetical protein
MTLKAWQRLLLGVKAKALYSPTIPSPFPEGGGEEGRVRRSEKEDECYICNTASDSDGFQTGFWQLA